MEYAMSSLVLAGYQLKHRNAAVTSLASAGAPSELVLIVPHRLRWNIFGTKFPLRSNILASAMHHQQENFATSYHA